MDSLEQPYPILEFDPSREAIIHPSHLHGAGQVPEHCVLCFCMDAVQDVVRTTRARELHEFGSEMGPLRLYGTELDGRPLAFVQPGLGAPFAVAILEEAIEVGCRRFIVCGGAGSLVPGQAAGHFVLPTAAVRDEGTSYHYLPPGRTVEPGAGAVRALRRALQEAGAPFTEGATWTTDAFYRETPALVQRRRDEGCLTVEMEAAALFAVAHFRGVELGALLYAGDDLTGPEWDPRQWNGRAATRRWLFDLAADACLRL